MKTFKPLKKFCLQRKISHSPGIPYNRQGQAIMKRAHQTLKNQIERLQSAKDRLTWTKIRTLVKQAKNLLENQKQPLTPCMDFVAFLALISAPPSVEDMAFWAYVPQPPLLQPMG